MKKPLPLVALLCAFALPSALTAQGDLAAILADTSRPQAEREADAGRRPAEVIRFFGIERGDRVADLLAGAGYWTRILVPLVGPEGRVYAGNNPFFAEYFKEAFDAMLADPKFANVVRIDGRVDQLALPADGSLDAVIMVNAYHDLYLTDEDRGALNRRVLAALKPGGVYGVIDHDAARGDGATKARSLHRVEKQTVVDEVTAAGFTLAGEGEFLRNPADDHTKAIFELAGGTDRFVLKFEKPRR
jgi:predicted methyltransferase